MILNIDHKTYVKFTLQQMFTAVYTVKEAIPVYCLTNYLLARR
jgi:hypothetical protein